MWFAARDVAFENPVTEDMTQTMLVRMGIVAADGNAADAEQMRAQRRGDAAVPRSRPLARDDAAAHGRPAVHRSLGVPHVRVGRRRACPTTSSSPATAGGASSCGASAPTRRRTSTTCAPRSPRCATARSSASRATSIAGHRGDRHAVGRRARAVARREPRELRQAGDAARSSTRSHRNRARAPRSSKGSTRLDDRRSQAA